MLVLLCRVFWGVGGRLGRGLIILVNQCRVLWTPHVVLHKFYNLFLKSRCSYINAELNYENAYDQRCSTLNCCYFTTKHHRSNTSTLLNLILPSTFYMNQGYLPRRPVGGKKGPIMTAYHVQTMLSFFSCSSLPNPNF